MKPQQTETSLPLTFPKGAPLIILYSTQRPEGSPPRSHHEETQCEI